ncbi:uncharacterized protein LOC131325685 isoform X2 [Rhododendron vialii]|uniref:uncharacterized protein LOC131325685 isoform X2 n=1 Tax=Rhododendron vialii TaxID=182163 RepID=UPI00265F301D|nr:uncharacterized protein LOC131325685 isoform X2 [Rhododendron vialii]
MGEKRIRGQPQKEEEEEELVVENEGKKKKSEAVSGYEQFRDQRIKENMERLQKLGILDLSRNLKPEPKKRLKKDPSQKKPSSTSSDPPRRSSRLQTVERVVYVEKRTPKKKARESEEIEIHIEEGSKPEIYTEEDMKLLGDSKTAWTLMVDGYGEDGERIYDPFYGKSCHQCRQKTLGHRTSCSTCTSVQGQFCGDCLYTSFYHFTDMGKIFWKQTKIQVGFALYVEEFVTAAVVDGQKDGHLLLLSTKRSQKLASSLWHIISFKLVSFGQSRKNLLLKVPFLGINHPLST